MQGLAYADGAPSAAQVVRELRESGLDLNECYRVRDLSFVRDDIKLFFNDGYLIFSKPVQGRVWAALFTAEVEGGDGEIILIPPTREERRSLASFTQSPNLDEHVKAALIVSTAGLEDSLLPRIQSDAGARRAPDMGPSLAAEWNPDLDGLATRMQMRLVGDLFTPKPRLSELTLLALNGNNLGPFDVLSEGRAGRRIEVRQPVNRAGVESVNVLTSFLPRATRNRPASEWRRPSSFQPLRYRIDAEIGPDLTVKARSKVIVRVGSSPVRAFPFEIASAMSVSGVRIDGAPAELLRDTTYRNRLLANGTEDEFLVVPPDELSAGSEHEFEFQHEGNVISTRGDGVYFVNARGSWYPHVSGAFSTFDLQFRYPRRLTLVAAGGSVEEKTDGDWKTTHSRVDVPIGAAGFNLGVYEKVSGTAAGVSFEVYGNRNLETSLRPQPADVPELINSARGVRGMRMPPTPPPTLVTPDPLGRLRVVAADLSSALEFFSASFGPPALKTLTVAPIPGTFGQGFPGLVYLSTFAYLDPLERPAALRNAREQAFFSDLLVPHEAAHQWWGSVVTANQREDQWLIEALANYSALLWMERKKGFKAVQDVLDNYRAELLSKDPAGDVRESAGPLVWGDRLESLPTEGAWRVVTYDKGTWVLHMLRRRLGDEAFFRLLKTARTRFEFRSISTQDFQALAREVRPPNVSAEAIDTFFENWVYRTGIPAIKLRSSVKSAGPTLKLSGTLEQSGVEDDFAVDIPVEIQSGRAVQTVWLRSNSDGRSFSADAQPSRHQGLGRKRCAGAALRRFCSAFGGALKRTTRRLTGRAPLRYPGESHGKHDISPEARPHYGKAHCGERHPQNPLAPRHPHDAPVTRNQGRERGHRSGSANVFFDRPRGQVGHHQEEHGRPLQEPPDVAFAQDGREVNRLPQPIRPVSASIIVSITTRSSGRASAQGAVGFE